MLNIILLTLVIVAYISANIIMSTISIQSGNTIKDILDEQDYGLGKAGVILVYWPALLFIYIRSLRSIDNSFSFEENEEEE